MKSIKSILKLFCILLYLFISSCDNSENPDGRHPVFIKAENFYDEGNIKDAYQLYERYFQLNPKSAKASYKLALISQDRGDYVKAIYYYEKYLELDTNSSDRKIIQKWIEASKKSLVKEISRDSPVSIDSSINKTVIADTEVAILKEKNEELQKQLDLLKESKNIDTDTAKQQLSFQTQQSIKYIVEEGDTLYKISRKFYGSIKYYKQIIEVNKETLKGGTSIKPGDILIIPAVKME
ncbi:MAG TPA: hypothetical protein DD381_12685 [Lentisphaeria bacterium]|nr:MAG: hypothetical protein A2X47_12255 [Lentisphaerae bacterium GWF2_38_69]HBM17181.1 hypothetical protein [Lentisphaeria bacterium]